MLSVDGASSEWWAHVPAEDGCVSVAYVDIAESRLPGVPECGAGEPQPGGPITCDALVTMSPGEVGDQTTVEAGLPSLNAETSAAGISTRWPTPSTWAPSTPPSATRPTPTRTPSAVPTSGSARQHLGGSVPAGINCPRPALTGARDSTMRQTEERFADEMRRSRRLAARR